MCAYPSKTSVWAPSSGSADVDFTLTAEQATSCAGKSLVVFENLTLDGTEVTKREDLADQGQTFEVESEEAPPGGLSTNLCRADRARGTLPRVSVGISFTPWLAALLAVITPIMEG